MVYLMNRLNGILWTLALKTFKNKIKKILLFYNFNYKIMYIMSFEDKYLKYKNKYLNLKNNLRFTQYGGGSPSIPVQAMSLQQLIISKSNEYNSLLESTSGTLDKNTLQAREQLRLEIENLVARLQNEKGYGPNGGFPGQAPGGGGAQQRAPSPQQRAPSPQQRAPVPALPPGGGGGGYDPLAVATADIRPSNIGDIVLYKLNNVTGYVASFEFDGEGGTKVLMNGNDGHSYLNDISHFKRYYKNQAN